MKKKTIISIILCMLLLLTTVPVIGYSIQTEDINNSNTTQPHSKAPMPGYAPIPPSDTLIDVPLTREHPQKSQAKMDDIVISMLEQVDEVIYLDYLTNLVGFGPRVTGTSACIAAAEYIYSQFESTGLTVRYHPWNYGGYSSNNVEATINGTDETSDEIYIICGHYDTVSSSPGADDDASGVVAVLTAAYIMSQYQFNHTIKFVAFSGEEEGLYGSRVYAQQAAAAGWNIAGVLNCDMISYAITHDDGYNLDVYENSASEWLYTYTTNINTEYSEYIQLTLHHAGTSSGSDHYYFWQNGYAAVFYFEYTMTPYYHSSQDTIQHINATYAAKNIRLILATLAELAEGSYPSNPPAKPTRPIGPTLGIWYVEYTYSSTTTEPDNEQIFYRFDWGDGNNSGWIGPYSSGQPGTASHSWTKLGTYNVTVKAKDIWGSGSVPSDPLTVVITDNTPPNPPTITGETNIKPNREYTYSLNGTDNQNQDLTYYIDWGDGNAATGLGPYHSGEAFTVTHSWKVKGTYIIKSRTTDTEGATSEWASIEVIVPFEYQFSFNTFFQHLFERYPHILPILRHLLGY